VGKDYIICPFNYKLGPGGVSSKWCMLSFRGIDLLSWTN
jgi:hypothetical protein